MNSRILFISNTNPYSKRFGAEQRANALLEALIGSGYYVDIAYVGLSQEAHPNKDSIVYWHNSRSWNINGLEKILRLTTLKMFPRSKSLSQTISKIIEKNNYRAIVCRYLPTAIACGLEKYAHKLIIDFDDWPPASLEASLKNPKDYSHSIYYRMMIRSAERQSRQIIQKAATVFLANADDAKRYKCEVLPNISLFSQNNVNHLTNNHNVLFIGKLDYRPNREGVDWFLRNVWPIVSSNDKTANFYIAGGGVDNELKKRWESFHGAHVLGFVDSIENFYNIGNIVVCPIHSGSGTNIKSIESLSMGKATVMTTFSAKGISLNLCSGKNAIIADSDKEMAKEIIDLIKNRTYCESIQKKGHELALELFTLESISNILTQSIQEISD